MVRDEAVLSRTLVAMVALLALVACGRDEYVEPRGMTPRPRPDPASYMIPARNLLSLNPTVRFTMLHPECGHSLMKRDSTEINLNWIGMATGFPEYHDCQKLIEPQNRREYAQLAALFATQQDRPASPDASKAYLLAYAINFGQANGSHTYAPLDMRLGISCVYAQLHPSASTAWLLPREESIDCVAAEIDTLALTVAGYPRLELKRTRIPEATAEDYPRVARWDWDSNRSEQYIGVECGLAWCEIGRPGFTPSLLPEVPPGVPMPNSRVYQIKGWFDVQRLAVFRSDGELIPGPEVGVIYPHPLLDSREPEDFAATVQGAIFTIDRTSTIYNKKFNMEPGSVSVVRVTKPSNGNNNWDGRARRGNVDKTVRVLYRPKPTPSTGRLRGTARWRWTDTDESAWMSCIHGCCQIDPW